MYSQALPTALAATQAGVSHSLCVWSCSCGYPSRAPDGAGAALRRPGRAGTCWVCHRPGLFIANGPRLRRFAEKYRRLRCRGVRLAQQTALDKKNRQVQDSLTVKRFVKKTYITQRGEL